MVGFHLYTIAQFLGEAVFPDSGSGPNAEKFQENPRSDQQDRNFQRDLRGNPREQRNG
jgi:hypothetical protein